VNRSTEFPVLVFVLLFALLLLLNGSSILSWAPESTSESREAIDRTPVEKANLAPPQAVGLFPDPVGIKVSANYQQIDSSIDATLNKITGKIRGVQTRLKHHHVHQAFYVKIISRHRPTANLVTQIHSWLVGELGLARTTNRRPWKDSYKWAKHQKAAAREFAVR
jgi:hypothetical protein